MPAEIERHVYLKLRSPEERERVAAEALRRLPGIPSVRAVRVGTPADPAAEVWDVCLVVEFERLADVASYLDHPTHRSFVAEVLEPAVEVRKAWNFRVRSGA